MLSATITLISAINALSKRIWKDFVIQIISSIIPAPPISPIRGKLAFLVFPRKHWILYRHSHLKEVALDKRHLGDVSCDVSFGVAGRREYPMAI